MAPISDCRRAARPAWIGCLFSASLTLAAACGGTATETLPDAGASGGAGPDAKPNVLDATHEPACQPGELRGECLSESSGCPSVEECNFNRSGFYCPCKRCELGLDPSECGWSLRGVYLSQYGTVVRDAARSLQLPQFSSEAECGESAGWWFAEVTYSAVSIRLCPASCREHQSDAGARFLLQRGDCPVD